MRHGKPGGLELAQDWRRLQVGCGGRQGLHADGEAEIRVVAGIGIWRCGVPGVN